MSNGVNVINIFYTCLVDASVVNVYNYRAYGFVVKNERGDSIFGMLLK